MTEYGRLDAKIRRRSAVDRLVPADLRRAFRHVSRDDVGRSADCHNIITIADRCFRGHTTAYGRITRIQYDYYVFRVNPRPTSGRYEPIGQ